MSQPMAQPVTHSHGGAYSGSGVHPHIVLPKWLIAIRVLQLIFAIVILGLVAFLINRTIGFTFNAEGVTLFTCLATIIIVIYAILAERKIMGESRNHLFALFALEIFIVIFWIASMSDMAWLRSIFTATPVIYDDFFKQKRDIVYYAGSTYLSILTAATVLSAFELVLFIITLVFVGMAFHRFRVSHLGRTGATTGTALGHIDPEKQHSTQAPYTAAPAAAPYQQPAYQQQPAATPYQQEQQYHQQQSPAAPYQQAPVSAIPGHHEPTYSTTDNNGMYGSQPAGTHQVPHQTTGGVSPIQAHAQPAYTQPHSNATEVPAHTAPYQPSGTA